MPVGLWIRCESSFFLCSHAPPFNPSPGAERKHIGAKLEGFLLRRIGCDFNSTGTQGVAVMREVKSCSFIDTITVQLQQTQGDDRVKGATPRPSCVYVA